MYKKDYVVSYGFEIEWGDIDRRVDIPLMMGSWEGPKMENGYYAGAERDINNSDGTLCDPLCETTPLGGEINVAPRSSIDDIVSLIADFKELFGNPYAGMVNHGHLHVYIPEADKDKLADYTKRYEKELVDLCYDWQTAQELYDDKEIDHDTYDYLMYDGGRLNSFDGRRSLQHDTGNETSSPRAAVNFFNLSKGNTLEFRCFRSTTDISLIRNCFIMAREFIRESQVENGLSPNQIAERYSLTFPKLPTDVIVPHFIRDRHPKERGNPYKYRSDNKNIWVEPVDYTIFDKVKHIQMGKGMDYGNMGTEPYIRERTTANILNKALRLSNLVYNNKTPSNESIDDTIVDLIGYCVLFNNDKKRH